jgi:hypothetical protein
VLVIAGIAGLYLLGPNVDALRARSNATQAGRKKKRGRHLEEKRLAPEIYANAGMMRDNTFVSLTSLSRQWQKRAPKQGLLRLAGPMTLVPAVTNPTTLFNTMVVALP